MSARVLPVVILGAGPTGLTAATLLGQYGVECLVLDRWETIYPQPRAVHLDDEIYRILARLGLRREFDAISWPCQGLRLLDRGMRVLAEFQRGTAPGRHGYPEANMFDQPELEKILAREPGPARDGHPPRQHRGHRADPGRPRSGPGRLHRPESPANPARYSPQYVLGCDGANSLARTAIGATMQDLGFEQRWLVVDVATTADLATGKACTRSATPNAPRTYMRIGKTRYRWEFRLAPGETADDYRDIARLHPLLSPWTRDIPVDELQIVRAAEYTFRAQLADRWRDRRIFLLGDAAHLTPPFIGQGMGAGLRDATNLAWKLAGVLDGTLPETVLDTYQHERKPHARALIRLANWSGPTMTEGGRLGDLIRSLLAPRLHLIPGVKQLVLNSQTPPLRRTDLVHRPPLRRSLAGTAVPQHHPRRRPPDRRRRRRPVHRRHHDRAHPQTTTPRSTQRGAALVVAEPGTELHRWLRRGGAHAAIVRPDGTVLRAGRDLTSVCVHLPTFHPSRRTSTPATDAGRPAKEA